MLKLNQHQVLCSTQSGYREGHSCVTILHKLHSDIETLNKGEVTFAVMVDYSKSFDTVIYSTLIKTLKVLKFSNSFIDLIIDYLSDRQQFLQIDDRKSPSRHVKFDAPQGSILSSAIQFAEGSTLYKSFKATQVSQGAKELENNLKSIQNWSNQKNLIFIATKTKSMLFSTHELSKRYKLHEKDTFATSSNDKETECLKSTKLLGITLNENLKWDDYINEILKTS